MSLLAWVSREIGFSMRGLSTLSSLDEKILEDTPDRELPPYPLG
jgi:hypothetical protein